MKKFISIVAAVAVCVGLMHAASVSIVLPPNGITNVLSGPLKVLQLGVSPISNSASVWFVDSPTNTLVYTNAAYTNYVVYETNLPSSWTNTYFGSVTTVTNLAMAIQTNSISASTNSYAVRASLQAAAGTSTFIQGASYYFGNGVCVTNASTNSTTVIVTYAQ
jgi:hypothetical protein